MSDRFFFDMPLVTAGQDPWVGVQRGGLQQRIEVKVAEVNGRPMVVGLRIDNQAEITSRSLRSIKVPELAKQLVAHIHELIEAIQPTDDALAAAEQYRGVLSHDWSHESSVYLEVWEAAAAADGLRGWLDQLENVDTRVIEDRPRGRGAQPPTEGELKAFARVYLEELRAGVHGAKTRTASRLAINRSTVYAWIRQCRELDLIPEEDR